MKIKGIITSLSRAHWLFVIIALIFGAILIHLTPPLWGADERAHFFRAYQVSEGRLVQNKQNINGKESYGGYIPASFNRLSELLITDVTDGHPGERRQVDDLSKYSEIGNVKISSDAKEPNLYGAIIYPTIAYTAPALGMVVANLFDPTALSLMYSARVATLLLFILLAFFSIYLLRDKSVKWIVFVVALLPMSLYQASVVSVDSLLLALSLIFISLTYRVVYDDKKTSRCFIYLMFVVSCLISLIKPPYVLLILPLLFLRFKNRGLKRTRRTIKLLLPSICLAIALLATISVKHLIAAPLPYTSFVGQLHWIVLHPFNYLYTLVNSAALLDWVPQTIGVFGTSFIFMPGPIIEILLVLLVSTAYIQIAPTSVHEEKIEHTKFNGFVFLSAGIVTSLAIVTTLYLTWTHIGAELIEGVQGRYFLPVVSFILVGLRMLTSARLPITEMSARIIFTSVVTLSLLSSMLWYYRVLY
jgi:uncharacterized membrane protein